MPFIPTHEICQYADCIVLHGAFEAVAAVPEKFLMQIIENNSLIELVGDWADPYRAVRGQGVGRPSIF